MPEGVEVLVENGFATIDFVDRSKFAAGLSALLAHTPHGLIQKLTRSGPRTQYQVPEGNAREAGLLDSASLVSTLPDRVDLVHGARLADADPNAFGEDHWHHPQNGVDGHAYVSDRDGDNGHIRGPLRPNKPVSDAPSVPAGASIGAADLQKLVKEHTPKPVAVSGAAVTVSPTPVPLDYPEGEPNDKWSRTELDAYAIAIKKMDTTDLPNKSAVLKAIANG